MIQIRQIHQIIFHSFLIKNTPIDFKVTLQSGVDQTIQRYYYTYIPLTSYTILNFLIFTAS